MAERLLRRARATHMLSRLITALAGLTRGLSTLFATDPIGSCGETPIPTLLSRPHLFAHYFDALRHKAGLTMPNCPECHDLEKTKQSEHCSRYPFHVLFPVLEEKRDGKDAVMKNTPEITMNGIVPVLSISPMEEDHFLLQDILNRVQGALDPSRIFKVNSCATLASGLAALRKHQFEVVVCERDLPPGSWKDVLEQVTIVPDPPSLIVTSPQADERLWAEALNLGAYDVLAKPFDSTEAMRVVGAAWRAWGGPVRLTSAEGAL